MSPRTDRSAISQLPEQQSADRIGVRDVGLVVVLEVAAMLLWSAYDAADVELVARTGSDVVAVGVAAVAVTTTLATAAALGLHWSLRRLHDPLRTWSIVAGAVWMVSFLGPLGAATGESMLGLMSFHLLVGGGIFFGVRRIHGR